MKAALRDLTSADLDAVVALHRAAFPGFLMTLLGPAFLKKYYETVLYCENRIFLGQFEDEVLQGFVAGFTAPMLFYSQLSKRKPQLLITAVFHLAWRPSLWLRVLENSGTTASRAKEGEETDAELASIAVTPSAQGKGYGKALINAFVGEAASRGVNNVHLSTDADKNDAVNRLYVSAGFTCMVTSTRSGGRRMNHYSMSLGGRPSTEKNPGDI